MANHGVIYANESFATEGWVTMKRLFEAVERHAVIFVLVTTLLAMASINFMAYLILGKDVRRKQTKNTLAQEEVLKKVFGEIWSRIIGRYP